MSCEQLECFPISSSTMSLGSWNQNFSQNWLILGKKILQNITNFPPFCSRDPQLVWKRHICNIFRGSFQKLSRKSNTNPQTLERLLHCKIKLDIENLGCFCKQLRNRDYVLTSSAPGCSSPTLTVSLVSIWCLGLAQQKKSFMALLVCGARRAVKSQLGPWHSLY